MLNTLGASLCECLWLVLKLPINIISWDLLIPTYMKFELLFVPLVVRSSCIRSAKNITPINTCARLGHIGSKSRKVLMGVIGNNGGC